VAGYFVAGESQRILPLQQPIDARQADAWRLGDICGAEDLRLRLAQLGRFERSYLSIHLNARSDANVGQRGLHVGFDGARA
jgi:hypothetical protein